MIKKGTIDKDTKRRYEKTWHQKLVKEGLVRILLYVKKDSVEDFQQQIYQRSNEYVSIHSQRTREKLAKVDWFEDFVQNKNHDYWVLRDENEQLRRENAALAPAFLQAKDLDSVALPLSIQQLEDNPDQLKRLLTISDRERKRATQLLSDYQGQAKRARLLQTLAEKRIELLEQRLIDNGLPSEVEVLVKESS
ncbi:hypothetical protein [Candidiatus Paracoxiella cheracis]|uniref:hypothetical protein n=1 Tax=Candidiatus Paracoxiella cheracis TaxID=3405120 RepID=UPI003BF53D70